MMHCLILIALAGAPTGAAIQHRHAAEPSPQAMGFDQRTTTHHFHLQPNGGAIEVTAKDAADSVSAEKVRSHLRHIATAFQNGDFSLPFLVHAAEPPGVAVMKERRALITYRFEELRAGARVTIQTSDAAARSAVHDFLRYQIREHKTGDPLEPRTDAAR